MRRASMFTQWYQQPGGPLQGLCLGVDATAEHECGIAHLRRRFGTAPDGQHLGLQTRQIRQLPRSYGFERFECQTQDGLQPAALLSSDLYRDDRPASSAIASTMLSAELTPNHLNLACSWDDEGFAVLAIGADQVEKLQRLDRAFRELDIAIAPAPGGFTAGGLSMVIASTVSAAERATIEHNDFEHLRLLDEAEKTGIAKKLKAAGCSYFALSPSWADKDHTRVRFWLNPTEQRRFNYGWFTADELGQWAEGRGPIVKTAQMATA